jgi:hypothetical protein
MFYLVYSPKPPHIKIISDNLLQFQQDHSAILRAANIETLQALHKRCGANYQKTQKQAEQNAEPTQRLVARANAFLNGYLFVLSNVCLLPFKKALKNGQSRESLEAYELLQKMLLGLRSELIEVCSLAKKTLLTEDTATCGLLDQIAALSIVIEYVMADAEHHLKKYTQAFERWHQAFKLLQTSDTTLANNPFWSTQNLPNLLMPITETFNFVYAPCLAVSSPYVTCLFDGDDRLTHRFELTKTFTFQHFKLLEAAADDTMAWIHIRKEHPRAHTPPTQTLHQQLVSERDPMQRLIHLKTLVESICHEYLLLLANIHDIEPQRAQSHTLLQHIRQWLGQVTLLIDYEQFDPALASVNLALQPCVAIMHNLAVIFSLYQPHFSKATLLVNYCDLQVTANCQNTLRDSQETVHPSITKYLNHTQAEAIDKLAKTSVAKQHREALTLLHSVSFAQWSQIDLPDLSKRLGFSIQKLITEPMYFATLIPKTLPALRRHHVIATGKVLMEMSMSGNNHALYATQIVGNAGVIETQTITALSNLLMTLSLFDIAHKQHYVKWTSATLAEFKRFYSFLQATLFEHIIICNQSDPSNDFQVPHLQQCFHQLKLYPGVFSPLEIRSLCSLIATFVTVVARDTSPTNADPLQLQTLLLSQFNRNIPETLRETVTLTTQFYTAVKLERSGERALADTLYSALNNEKTLEILPFYATLIKTRLACFQEPSTPSDQTALLDLCATLPDLLTSNAEQCEQERFYIVHFYELLWIKVKSQLATVPSLEAPIETLDTATERAIATYLKQYGIRVNHFHVRPHLDFFQLKSGAVTFVRRDAFYEKCHLILTSTDTDVLKTLHREQLEYQLDLSQDSILPTANAYGAMRQHNLALSGFLLKILDVKLALLEKQVNHVEHLTRLVHDLELFIRRELSTMANPIDFMHLLFPRLTLLMHLAKLQLLIALQDYPHAESEAFNATLMAHQIYESLQIANRRNQGTNPLLKSGLAFMCYNNMRDDFTVRFVPEVSTSHVPWLDHYVDVTLSELITCLVPHAPAVKNLLQFRHVRPNEEVPPLAAITSIPKITKELEKALTTIAEIQAALSQARVLKREDSLPELLARTSQIAQQVLCYKFNIDITYIDKLPASAEMDTLFKLSQAILHSVSYLQRFFRQQFNSTLPGFPFQEWYKEFFSMGKLRFESAQARGSLYLALLALEQWTLEQRLTKTSKPERTTGLKEFDNHLKTLQTALPTAFRPVAKALYDLHVAECLLQLDGENAAVKLYLEIATRGPDAQPLPYCLFAILKHASLVKTPTIPEKFQKIIATFANHLPLKTFSQEPPFHEMVLHGLFELLDEIKPTLSKQTQETVAKGIALYQLRLTSEKCYQETMAKETAVAEKELLNDTAKVSHKSRKTKPAKTKLPAAVSRTTKPEKPKATTAVPPAKTELLAPQARLFKEAPKPSISLETPVTNIGKEDAPRALHVYCEAYKSTENIAIKFQCASRALWLYSQISTKKPSKQQRDYLQCVLRHHAECPAPQDSVVAAFLQELITEHSPKLEAAPAEEAPDREIAAIPGAHPPQEEEEDDPHLFIPIQFISTSSEEDNDPAARVEKTDEQYTPPGMISP